LTEADAIRRFTALYEETRPRVYAFAVSHAGRQLADEIVSEVYLVAWRRLADVPQPELPWLLAVARNVSARQFRAAVRQQSIAAELRTWAAAAELTADDVGEQVAERHAVLAALATLSGPDRDLLTLVAWHGLTPAQAAQVVGCSTAAYFVRLHRARRRLERALYGRARGPDPVDPVGQTVPSQPRVLSQPEEGIR
jgi:RNA polymerase sigma-70 factor, ECF subfamily